MSEKMLFDQLIQVGILVRDLPTALEKYKTILGIEQFRIVKYPPEDEPNCERTYRGKAGNFEAKFCFFDYGNIELELIQPICGENIWDEFLAVHGNAAIHHVKYFVKDHCQVEQHFAALGIEKIQSGASVGINKGRSWAFYDTLSALGFYVEVMNVSQERQS